jgi:uncharacterized protein YeeX (DUF496 family)
MNKFDRIEGLVNLNDLFKFQESVNDITDDLLSDGFEYEDVKEYLIRELDSLLGDYDSHLDI